MTELERMRGVALVQAGGSVVLAACRGMADEESGAANDYDTRFQLASVSKQFTAAATLLLAEQGVLSVQDPVRQWITGCPAAWSPMTVHHLLTHTAGLGHWEDLPEIDVTARMEPAEEIAAFQRLPLRWAPGARWYYSSPGYVLLAHIAERAARRPYAGFLADELFGPLAMTGTFAGNGPGQPRRAVGYASGRPVRPYELAATGMGAGDIWSTAGDMAKWNAAIADRQLLSDASWAAMLTSHCPVDDAQGTASTVVTDGYGYGWFTGSLSGRQVFYHTGGNAGFRTVNGWIPAESARVTILTNEETTDIGALAGQVLAIALAS
jgi:CubicO group peptidase (beta-lactamase class C family)